MMTYSMKQAVLKPQDLLVALKVLVKKEPGLPYADLATELCMSSSEVHAAVRRAELSRLLRRDPEGIFAIRTSLLEFLIHGVKYSYPAVQGTLVRGMATGFAGPVLREYFNSDADIPQVWPDPDGDVRGISFQPLYPAVPKACRGDTALYEILTLVDAVRGGAARERELAKDELTGRLG